MTAELLVNVTPSETRVAYIDGGILQENPRAELSVQRKQRRVAYIDGGIHIEVVVSRVLENAGGFCRYWSG